MCGRSFGPRLAEPVAHPRPLFVEALDRLVDRGRVYVEPPRQVLEQRRQRGREMDVGHRYASTATSTEEIAGR